MKIKSSKPIVGFAAYSGTGKTTLMVNIIPAFKQRNIQVGVIKHAHHTFEIDQPGKDSYEIRKAGASQMLIGSKKRWALMVEEEENDRVERLQEYVSKFDQEKLDLILVEGFKPEAIPKIELHRPALGHPLISVEDESIIAIATDDKSALKTTLPILNINDPEEIAIFIIDNLM